MNLAGHDWLFLAWTQTWQVTLLILVVALLTRLTAANRPQLAFALWLVVLVKCVTPPLWSSPSGAFCWLQPPTANTEFVTNIKIAGGQRPAECQSVDSRPPRAVGPRLSSDASHQQSPQRQLIVGALWETEQPETEPSPRKDELPHSERIASSQPLNGLAWCWLAGATGMFALTTWRWMRFTRLLRRAGRAENAVCEDIMGTLRRRLRIRRPVRLIVTEHPLGPAVVGLLRPTVVLPQAAIENKPPEEIELILAHELIHLRRGDHWLGLLRSAVEALWWFHPLVWWASRRASREAERCCDEAVLAELQCGPGRYARCLLNVLALKQQLRCAPALPGVRAIEITQARLERIMRIGQGGYRRTPWWCWAVAIAAAVVVIPGAAIGTLKGYSVGPSEERPGLTADRDSGARDQGPAVSDQSKLLSSNSQSLIPNSSDSSPHPDPLPKGEGTTRDLPKGEGTRAAIIAKLPTVIRSSRPAASDPLFRAMNVAEPTTRREPTVAPPLRREPTLAPPPARSSSPRRSRYDGDRARDDYNGIHSRRFGDESLQDGAMTYVVGDILSTIYQQRGLTRPKDIEFLKNLLKMEVQRTPPSEALARMNAAVAKETSGAGNTGPAPTIYSDPIPIDIIWRPVNQAFEIETTAEGHRRVGKTLSLIREHGLGQIAINVRFLTGPAEELKKAKLKWTVLPTELPPSAAPNSDAAGDSRSVSRIDSFFDGRPRVNRVQFVTEKCPPMIYTVLADDAAAKLTEKWQANAKTNLLQAPKMTLFNGQPGFVHDCSRSPFVVAVKDGKPQVRVVHEGTILNLRPLAEEFDKLIVDFQVEFSKIGSVDTAELSETYQGKPITIQIPEVSATRVEGSVDLKWDQWLLLGSVETLSGGQKPLTVVMLRAEKIEPFHLAPKQEPRDVLMPGPTVPPPLLDRAPR
jgi:beta-lactamase regulating signal transducer with metallopeptidase domain